jgi:excinuclease ABC subunit A
METRHLSIKGARVHNLQNVSLELPRNELICFTGVSGSGKSSLAFDTIYAEGQRRYVESLSAYARQFLGQMEKPDVDQITGLSPTVSIEQKTAGRNPRSTVGTMTEIYDYLRVLFARIGTPHCIHDDTPIGAQTRDGIVDQIMALGQGKRFHVLASLVQGRKGEYLDLFEDLQKEGYIRARVDGQIITLTQVPKLERYKRHDIEVVIDRLEVKADMRARIGEAVDAGLQMGNNAIIVSPEGGDDILMSTNFSCPQCGRSAQEPTPQLFSFNSPQGMCGDCHGLGTRVAMDLKRVIPDESLSVSEGAIAPLGISKNRWKNHYYEGVLARHKADLKTPWKNIPQKGQKELLYGVEGRIQFEWRRRNGTVKKHRDTFEGILTPLERRFAESANPVTRKRLAPFMRVGVCPTCEGARLKAEALRVRINGQSLPDVTQMTIDQAHRFFDQLNLTETQNKIAEDALKEIRGRLTFLLDVGLNYLTLERTAPTLSGGEAQRIRLASQIGSGLVGVTYVLDEPSIGLHHRDNLRLLDALCRLRDVGNTVIVVEHDEETMMRSDRVIDFGPGPGHLGGEVVAQGTWKQVARSGRSITGAYLSGKRKIEVPERRPVAKRQAGIWIRGARQNNLKGIDVKIPLGVFTCVTGVSGSGKSSLIIDILYPALARDLNGAESEPGVHRRIEGMDQLDKVIEIDQQPIGRTPRSNPATYTGAFDPIRKLFSELPESKVRGYKPGRFSFNVKGGRCEACQGNGANLVEMDFLADVWVTCPVCEGKRFNRETLDIVFKGKSIADVLEMEVEEACAFFSNVPIIHRVLQTLVDVGMGYVRLGQPAPTLSGGEAQRVKLSKELCRTSTGKTLYILDEPTTGLHFSDIQNLLNVLHRLVDLGNSVVVIEHNMDVVKTADWVIELGPEGGEEGGYLTAVGTPDDLMAVDGSHTGKALKDVISGAHLLAVGNGRKNGKTKNAQVKAIEVWGAKENNLQDVNVSIPREKMTVISGVSGSGKSSLALDTIFAEGQRRYVESLSAYARQFLGQMPKPKVDRVVGLSPAIAIEQKAASKNPRSTVGTVTEIYDYVRALFGLLGEVYCPDCQIPAGSQTVSEIVKRVLKMPEGRRLFLLAPIEPGRGEDYNTLIERAQRGGYLRGRIDGDVFNLDKAPEIDYRQTHRLEVLVDRVTASKKNAKRIADSAEKALALSGGILIVASPDDLEETRFSQHLSCNECGKSFEPVTPQRLSFNSPEGWCLSCEGLGTQRGMGVHTLIPDPRKTLAEGAVLPWGNVLPDTQMGQMVMAIGEAMKFDLDTPFAQMTEQAQQAILYGLGNRWLVVAGGLKFQFKGLFPAIETLVRQAPRFRRQMGEFIQDVPCPSCRGHRINPVGAAVRLRGKTLPDVVKLPIRDVRIWFEGLSLKGQEHEAAGEVLAEIHSRLRFLDEVGLGYIDLSRKAPTLSGGEAQRIRLASQIGSGLTGVLYVLDEPTIGLHQRDNRRLLAALERLRDLGNSLLVVEHDRDTLEAADYILDFGPGAGTEGGQLVAAGVPKRLALGKGSLTAQYLKDKMRIEIPAKRRCSERGELKVVGARHNNLKQVDVAFPLGLMTCVTGVSGSGKSSLVNDVLYGALAARVNGAQKAWGEHDDVLGLELVDKVINIDQTPIGFSPRSNPATYVKVFDAVRTLYSNLPDAQVRGFKPGHFSFNHKRGRCDACRGLGARCIEMHFLPDVWVTCETCVGKRYNRDVVDITYKGASIADVLTMTVAEALAHFENVPSIRRSLQTLFDVGLGYIKMGQASTTLSGGEAQRVKLARELARPNTGKTVYILDEPTTGLHFADIQKLLVVLNRLVDAGNTVIVIEHNLDVVKTADWVIDLGPEGGEEGGQVVAQGTPEAVMLVEGSHTGRFLQEVFAESVLV